MSSNWENTNSRFWEARTDGTAGNLKALLDQVPADVTVTLLFHGYEENPVATLIYDSKSHVVVL